jgi:hypothetical protein
MRGHGGTRRKLGAASCRAQRSRLTGDSLIVIEISSERGRLVTDSRRKTAAKGLERRSRPARETASKAAELKRARSRRGRSSDSEVGGHLGGLGKPALKVDPPVLCASFLERLPVHRRSIRSLRGFSKRCKE